MPSLEAHSESNPITEAWDATGVAVAAHEEAETRMRLAEIVLSTSLGRFGVGCTETLGGDNRPQSEPQLASIPLAFRPWLAGL